MTTMSSKPVVVDPHGLLLLHDGGASRCNVIVGQGDEGSLAALAQTSVTGSVHVASDRCMHFNRLAGMPSFVRDECVFLETSRVVELRLDCERTGERSSTEFASAPEFAFSTRQAQTHFRIAFTLPCRAGTRCGPSNAPALGRQEVAASSRSE